VNEKKCDKDPQICGLLMLVSGGKVAVWLILGCCFIAVVTLITAVYLTVNYDRKMDKILNAGITVETTTVETNQTADNFSSNHIGNINALGKEPSK
jgi:hypothetical protein